MNWEISVPWISQNKTQSLLKDTRNKMINSILRAVRFNLVIELFSSSFD